MKHYYFLFPLLLSSLLFSCNGPETKTDSKTAKLVFHFELNSVGEITDKEVKEKLAALAKDICRNADRIMLTAYSEQTGNQEKNLQIAATMAEAAKQWMAKNSERVYYNVGVTVKGYEDPINAAKPADAINRRIEFTYLTP